VRRSTREGAREKEHVRRSRRLETEATSCQSLNRVTFFSSFFFEMQLHSTWWLSPRMSANLGCREETDSGRDVRYGGGTTAVGNIC
jgi:hypothetical protein